MDCQTLYAPFLADFFDCVSLPCFLQMNWPPFTPVLSVSLSLSPGWSLCWEGSFTPQVSAGVSFEAFSDAEVDESLTQPSL